MATKNITVPDLGGATDVVVIEILVKEGDKLTVDMPVVTLESDKATMEIPATEEGIVKTIQLAVGDKTSSGATILTLDTSADAPAKADKTKSTEEKIVPQAGKQDEKSSSSKKQKNKASKHKPESTPVLTGTLEKAGSDVHAGPGVRRFARELGVNLSLVTGNGPKQRILKEDVQTFVKSQLTQVQTTLPATGLSTLPVIDFSKFGVIETEALSRIKKISGKNLQRNWMLIPHVTQFGEADITSLDEFRLAQKESLEKQKVKLTPLVFVMKAIVASLKAYPHFNASLDPSGEQLILKKYFHVGIAVDTADGLIVPIIRDVDKKGLIELAQELNVVSEQARNKRLTPDQMQGGCFSISSLGGIGGTAFTPIINFPEVAILGVSKTSYKPVYENGAFVPRLMLPLSLSYDHRVIDGAEGARFMMHLTNMLSDIRNLLL